MFFYICCYLFVCSDDDQRPRAIFGAESAQKRFPNMVGNMMDIKKLTARME